MGSSLNRDWSDWNRKVVDEFRANGGKVDGMLGTKAGKLLLLLHTKGAKSQQEHINPVAFVRDGERFVVIAGLRKSGFAPTNPDWYYNIVAHPELTVEVGKETFPVHATVTEEPERTRLYNKMVQMMPTFDDRRKTNRKLPVILLTPMK